MHQGTQKPTLVGQACPTQRPHAMEAPGGGGGPGVYQLADSPSEKGGKKGEQCHPWILSHETAAGHAPGLG